MDGIIFDVDGTIWDSTDPVAEAWNLAIEKNSSLDVRVDRRILSRLFGKTMTEIGDTLFPMIEDANRRGALLDACYSYENLYLEEHPGTLYEGVTETIRSLSEKYPLFIVSNCQCGYIEVVMKCTGIGPYIKDHLCFGETQTPKGKTIRTLMERNGLKDVVYVGDTQGDADACRAAGVPFIFAEFGFGDVPDAEIKIQKFSDLKTLYL